MRKLTIATAFFAVLTASAAQATMPSECLQKLHSAEVTSEMAQEAIKRVYLSSEKMMIVSAEMLTFNEDFEFVRNPEWDIETWDVVNFSSVVNTAGSDFQHLAYVTEIHLGNTTEAFDCIARNWPSSTGTNATEVSLAPTKHEIPVCGPDMAQVGFEDLSYCPSPWVEIWSSEFTGIYKQVWHCPESNSQFGTVLGGGCGSAWLPQNYARVQ